MNQTIEVDAEVYDCLKAAAEPFIDTPNSVLRRILGLNPGPLSEGGATRERAGDRQGVAAKMASNGSESRGRSTSSKRRSRPKSKPSERKRVPAGSILPEEEYEMPLLESLIDAGGSGASRDIVEAVGERLDSRLTGIDRQPLKSGAIRWENRIQFVRLKMIERGWMEKDTGRGIWAISDEGRKHVERSAR